MRSHPHSVGDHSITGAVMPPVPISFSSSLIIRTATVLAPGRRTPVASNSKGLKLRPGLSPSSRPFTHTRACSSTLPKKMWISRPSQAAGTSTSARYQAAPL